jgi:hypothetical protein
MGNIVFLFNPGLTVAMKAVILALSLSLLITEITRIGNVLNITAKRQFKGVRLGLRGDKIMDPLFPIQGF